MSTTDQETTSLSVPGVESASSVTAFFRGRRLFLVVASSFSESNLTYYKDNKWTQLQDAGDGLQRFANAVDFPPSVNSDAVSVEFQPGKLTVVALLSSQRFVPVVTRSD